MKLGAIQSVQPLAKCLLPSTTSSRFDFERRQRLGVGLM